MITIDIILIGVLGVFVLAGFWFGLVHMAGSIVGLFVATIVAGRYYLGLADWLGQYVDSTVACQMLSFIFLFSAVVRLFGLAFWLVRKAFKFVTIIPFVSTFNRLLGALLGLVEGLLSIGLLIWFASRLPGGVILSDALNDSALAGFFVSVGKVLSWLMPVAIQAAQSLS